MKYLIKIFYVSGMLAIIGFFFMFFLSIYWTYYPYNIEKIYDQQAMPMQKTILRGGDVISWRAHYIIYIGGIRAESTYYLESADTKNVCDFKILHQTSSVTKEGESDHYSAMVAVPQGFRPCIYHVRIQTNFHPNPNRIITIEAMTSPFQVL